MFSDGSADWLWVTTTFRSLPVAFSWSESARTRLVSSTVDEVSRTRETRAQERPSPEASTSASLARCRIARSCDQCFGQRKRPSVEIVARGHLLHPNEKSLLALLLLKFVPHYWMCWCNILIGSLPNYPATNDSPYWLRCKPHCSNSDDRQHL